MFFVLMKSEASIGEEQIVFDGFHILWFFLRRLQGFLRLYVTLQVTGCPKGA